VEDEKNELVRKILQVCAGCPHFKKDASCDRKKSQCHSKRVRQWLERIEELEQKGSGCVVSVDIKKKSK